MKTFTTLFLSFLLSYASAEDCTPIAAGTIKNLWNKWNQALQTLEPEKVSELYHRESVLLPTLSNKVRDDVEGKLNYFEHFLAKKPVGTIDLDFVDVKYCNMATHNGIYTFDLTAAGTVAQARFTYVYTFEDGEWKIKTHHSSLMPEQGVSVRRSLRQGANAHSQLAVSGGDHQKCADISKEKVKELWKEWADSLSTTPHKVAELYWNHESFLLPTLSDKIRGTKEEKIEYFEHFLQKRPVASIDQDFVTLGCNTAQYSGIYSFKLTNPETFEVTNAMARFTYVFTTGQNDGAKGNWKIETHHSSLMPNSGGLSGERRLQSEDLVENFDRSGFSETEKLLEFTFA